MSMQQYGANFEGVTYQLAFGIHSGVWTLVSSLIQSYKKIGRLK